MKSGVVCPEDISGLSSKVSRMVLQFFVDPTTAQLLPLYLAGSGDRTNQSVCLAQNVLGGLHVGASCTAGEMLLRVSFWIKETEPENRDPHLPVYGTKEPSRNSEHCDKAHHDPSARSFTRRTACGRQRAFYQGVDCIDTHLHLGPCTELSAFAQLIKREDRG